MKKNKYDIKVENVLNELREDLINIVNKYGPIKLFNSEKYRLVIGSYKATVATTLYVENNHLKLICNNWINYDIYIDDDFDKTYNGVGTISYTDQLNLYKLVCDIINNEYKK